MRSPRPKVLTLKVPWQIGHGRDSQIVIRWLDSSRGLENIESLVRLGYHCLGIVDELQDALKRAYAIAAIFHLVSRRMAGRTDLPPKSVRLR